MEEGQALVGDFNQRVLDVEIVVVQMFGIFHGRVVDLREFTRVIEGLDDFEEIFLLLLEDDALQ